MWLPSVLFFGRFQVILGDYMLRILQLTHDLMGSVGHSPGAIGPPLLLFHNFAFNHFTLSTVGAKGQTWGCFCTIFHVILCYMVNREIQRYLQRKMHIQYNIMYYTSKLQCVSTCYRSVWWLLWLFCVSEVSQIIFHMAHVPTQ